MQVLIVVDKGNAIGEIRAVREFIPGVYYLTAQKNSNSAEEYYVVAETAAIFAAVRSYGYPHPGLRLFPVSEDTSGGRIVEYELCKYQILHSDSDESADIEQELRRIAFFAAGYHPEYFGEYPVPVLTPRGVTIRTASTGWRPAGARRCWRSATPSGTQSLPV